LIPLTLAADGLLFFLRKKVEALALRVRLILCFQTGLWLKASELLFHQQGRQWLLLVISLVIHILS